MKNKKKATPLKAEKTLVLKKINSKFNFYSEGTFKSEKSWKTTFYISFILISILTFISGFNSSFHQDEMDMNAYGKNNLLYYSSFGADTSYLHSVLPDGTKVSNIIKNYGGLFENIACGINKIFDVAPENEFKIRHIICQVMGLLTIFIASLITKLLKGGYAGAQVTLLLLFCTPFFYGHTIFNTKDIPFAFGYSLTIYSIIRYLLALPKIDKTSLLFMAVGLAIAIGTRIGGVILIGIIGLFIIIYFFINKATYKAVSNQYKSHLMGLTIAIGMGIFIAILNWPFVLSDPFQHLVDAFNVVSKFPQRIPLMFEGRSTDSLHIPWYYSLKWMSLTIPTAILILFILSLIYSIINRKVIRIQYYFYILIAIIAPVFYSIWSKMALYSSWRHLLFIYPLLVVFASLILIDFLSQINKKYQIASTILVSIILLCHPIYWSIKNHPFEYIYFNEISGGFEQNYYQYETDYWQVGIQKAVDWLYANEKPQLQKDVIIGTNAVPVTDYLTRNKYHDTLTKINYCGINAINLFKWKYLIVNVVFLNGNRLNKSFPPYGTIHTINVDGKPVCAIVKREERLDYEAVVAMDKKDYKTADSLANLYLLKDPYAETIYEVSAISKASMNDWNNCFISCQKGLKIFPTNQKLLYYTGVYFGIHQVYDKAIYYLELSIQKGNPPTKLIYKQLSNLYHIIQDDERAMYYYKLSL